MKKIRIVVNVDSGVAYVESAYKGKVEVVLASGGSDGTEARESVCRMSVEAGKGEVDRAYCKVEEDETRAW